MITLSEFTALTAVLSATVMKTTSDRVSSVQVPL
jgi:hypothetical protein